MRWRAYLDGLAAVCMIAASITFVTMTLSIKASVKSGTAASGRLAKPELSIPKDAVVITDAARAGRDNAAAAVIEYSDFQCPFCARFARETWPRIRERYVDTGRVLFVFRHLPLTSAHAFAMGAAAAAECSRRQGRFWDMHTWLFEGPGRLAPENVRGAATALGLDNDAFDRCLQADAQTAVAADLAQAQLLGVQGTPTFFLGAPQNDGRIKVIRRETGFLTVEAFSTLLDNLLAELAAK